MIHVVLYRPEKPANTGNIMRTCSAIGAQLHLIGPLPFKLNDEFLARACMDYVRNMDYHYYADYDEFIKSNPKANLYYVTRYGSQTPNSFDFKDVSEDYYVMFGRESTGIPKNILAAHLNRCLRIPMKPFARSLNLANSVAIVVYEILRQQDYYELATSDLLKGDNYLEK